MTTRPVTAAGGRTPHDLALRAIAALALTVPACEDSGSTLQSTADVQAQTDTAGTTGTDAQVADLLVVADAGTGADAGAGAGAGTGTDAGTGAGAGTDATVLAEISGGAGTDATVLADVSGGTDVASGGDAGGAPLCTATPNDADCCMHLGEWCQTQFPPEELDAIAYCQFGPNYDASTGCSPWGPPAPPRFEPAAWGLA